VTLGQHVRALFLSTVFASWLAYFTLFTALAGPVVLPMCTSYLTCYWRHWSALVVEVTDWLSCLNNIIGCCYCVNLLHAAETDISQLTNQRTVYNKLDCW